MKKFAFAAAVVGSLLGPVLKATEGASSSRPKEYIVAIDLSASRTPAMLADASQFLNHLVQRLSFGDQFVIVQMQQAGLQDHPKRWQATMPTPHDPTYVTSRDRDHLAAAQRGITLSLPNYLKPEGAERIVHTDIFTTINVIGEYASEAGSKQITLFMLSDMLQSTKAVEMEHAAHMPPPNWIDSQRRQGLLPVLTGACVVVVGADATTTEGARVRRFWQDYFTAAGASLPVKNYRATPPTTDPGC